MSSWLQRLLGDTQAKTLALLRRSRRTIAELSGALRLTDNAVRTHIADLRRDGLVADVGTQRDTGGKPARLYGLTKQGEELFPKAYALVLRGLVEEIARNEGDARAVALLQTVGRRVAASRVQALEAAGARPEDRVETAAAVLRELGADLELQRADDGWRLQGYGCPLSAVTASHPQVCALAQGIVEAITGRRVQECCERSDPDRPRCAFLVTRP